MAHLRHLEYHYSKYWSLENAFSVQSKFLFVFNSAILQLPPAKSYLRVNTVFHWFFINVGMEIWWHTSYMICLFIYHIIVCFAEIILSPREKQNTLQTISFLNFNLNYFFQYIWDETLDFKFQLFYNFNMYLPCIWKKDIWKCSDSKEDSLNIYVYIYIYIYILFQQSKNFILTDLPKLGSQYSPYFCLELPPDQKMGPEDLSSFCEASREWGAQI